MWAQCFITLYTYCTYSIKQEVEQITANVFYSTFLNVFKKIFHVFYVYNILFYYFLNVFSHL